MTLEFDDNGDGTVTVTADDTSPSPPAGSYATAADYTDEDHYPQAAVPADIARLLRSASRLVTRATMCDLYDVDANGQPTDAVIAGAFRDATCAQVYAWQAAGIDPAGGGLAAKGLISSKSLDGGSVSYDNTLTASSAGFQARQQLATSLCDEALLILQSAGMAGGRPWEYG